MSYIFDVDGTLTPSRQKMDPEFQAFFKSFMVGEKVFLVSGSDYEKIVEQVGEEIARGVNKVFACAGNDHWVDGQNVHREEFKPTEEFIDRLVDFIEDSEYSPKVGSHLEARPGMINMSTVGREATLEQRKQYLAWDSKNKEREYIVDCIKAEFPEMDATIGGEISIDIYPKGKDKSQVVFWTPMCNNFFGDKMEEGGNDYPLAQALLKRNNYVNKIFPVKSWEETYEILKAR